MFFRMSYPFAILLLITLHFPAVSHAQEAIVHKDITFATVKLEDGSRYELKLDLYMPANKKNPPLVVWIHGGGWYKGDRLYIKTPWLPEEGFAMASISYRLTDKAIYPAQLHDCKAAIRWLRANHAKYGYSIKKIGVAGASAGGHLAALVGVSSGMKELKGKVGDHLDQSAKVDVVIDYYGATDFIQRTKSQPHKTVKEGSIVYKLLGGPADKNIDLAKLASPAFHVTKDDPPMFVMHGDKDTGVLMAQSERIVKAYKEASLPVEFMIIEGGKHGGKDFFSGDARKRVVTFLNKYLLSH